MHATTTRTQNNNTTIDIKLEAICNCMLPRNTSIVNQPLHKANIELVSIKKRYIK